MIKQEVESAFDFLKNFSVTIGGIWYQLSFSSKTRKSRANSSISFFSPKLLERKEQNCSLVCSSITCSSVIELKHPVSTSGILNIYRYTRKNSDLPQLRRQITNGPINPLYRSCWRKQQHDGVFKFHYMHACMCVCHCTFTTSAVE